MDWSDARARFAYLAEALDGVGGFAPRVRWDDETVAVTNADGTLSSAIRRVPRTAGPCHLVQHGRESAEKYAGRCAVAVYENHLRHAVERFSGFLARRRALRDGADSPLAALLLADADLRGTGLDAFMTTLALHLKARGTMFVLLDRPRAMDEAPASLLEQSARRAVPYLRLLPPESVESFDLDPLTGELQRLTLCVVEPIDGKLQQAHRTWDAQTWSLHVGDRVVASGPHGFARCPVLDVTESGSPAPVVGRYAQIADLSRRIFNARSELDDILRSQNFSVFTYQIPPGSTRTAAEVAVTLGTQSMILHEGIAPSFVAPDSGPAETYRAVLQDLAACIRRVAGDDSVEQGGQPESGLARRMRFEQLNAELAGLATQLQGLERRIWALFHSGLGVNNPVTVEYPTDFNLVDTLAELDILAAMQATAFPPAVLALKRKAIAAAEFDAADDDDKASALAAIDEQPQEPSPAAEPPAQEP